MIQEQTIIIQGQEVRMRYCAAAETGYERLSGRTINIFTPTPIKWDDKGKATEVEPAKAIEEDFIFLAYAAIIAAYSRTHEEPPVTAEQILYDAAPKEVVDLIRAVVKLRNAWYEVPDTIENDTQKDESPKNA